jgi:lysozyme
MFNDCRTLSDAITVLKLDEGVRSQPYRDSKGLWTVGVGRLIGAQITDLKLSENEIDYFLINDIEKHWKEAVDIFGAQFLSEITPARQIAILSMLFTLGKSKFLKFENTISAIKSRDWERAAQGILKSKWARDVDPRQQNNAGRDNRVADMLRSGQFPEFYKIPK